MFLCILMVNKLILCSYTCLYIHISNSMKRDFMSIMLLLYTSGYFRVGIVGWIDSFQAKNCCIKYIQIYVLSSIGMVGSCLVVWEK